MFYIFNYFSIWLLFWFILYKFKIIKYQPSFCYIMAFLYVTIKFLLYFILESVELDIFIKNISISILLDAIPLYFLLPLNLNIQTLFVNLFYILLYILTMCVNNINIIDLYSKNILYKFHIK